MITKDGGQGNLVHELILPLEQTQSLQPSAFGIVEPCLYSIPSLKQLSGGPQPLKVLLTFPLIQLHELHWENKQGMLDICLYSVYNPWLKQPRPGPGDLAETNIDDFFLPS